MFMTLVSICHDDFIDYTRSLMLFLHTVAPPTQGTWRSNDYVSAFRLVDAC